MVFKQYRFDLPGKDGRVNPEECNYIICYMRFYSWFINFLGFFLGLSCRIFEALERVLAIVEGGRLGNEGS